MNSIYTQHISLKFRLLLLLIFVSFASVLEAQRLPAARLRGEVCMEEGRYVDALKEFADFEQDENAVLDESYLHSKAEVYYKLADFDNAARTYKMAFDDDTASLDLDFMRQLILRSSNQKEFQYLLTAIEDALEIPASDFVATPSIYEVRSFHAVNTSDSEFGLVQHSGRLYFSSVGNKFLSPKDVNTESIYYDIFSIDSISLGELEKYNYQNYQSLSDFDKEIVALLKTDLVFKRESALSTKYNDGPVQFLNNSIAVVTVNEKHKKNKEIAFNLTLRESLLVKDTVSDDAKLTENYFGKFFSPNSVGHITFSPDGQRACFVVKDQAAETGSDLWFSDFAGNKWSTPYSAGAIVNTSSDEVFPFLGDDNILYYSSDGMLGCGGLDIYKLDLNDSEPQPVNMGMGINSNADDFAFSLNADGNGYLTSNRDSGMGLDDIYTVHPKYGNIKVILMVDTFWVDEPRFGISDDKDQSLSTFSVMDDSVYLMSHLPYGDYNLTHLLPEDSLYNNISLYEDTAYVYVNFPVYEPDTLPVSFTNFCFNCDGMDAINRAKFERMLAFLVNFPTIEIHLTGNTDMFGADRYNERLGMRRSDIMERWLREAGVTNPITKFSNGKRKLISETDHELNRRVDVELFWPGEPEHITFISRTDERLDRDVVIIYDDAKDHVKEFEPGYYALVYRSNRYITKQACAENYGLGDQYDILLHSSNSNVFSYYIELSFETAVEANKFIQEHELRAKLMYLDKSE